MGAPPRYDVPVHVTKHAVWRAYERFPGFDTTQIVAEVVDALRDGRVSASRPPGIWSDELPDCLYVWTADGSRVYVITPNRFRRFADFAVKTALRPSDRDEFDQYRRTESPYEAIVTTKATPGAFKRTRRVRGRKGKK